MIEQWCCVQKKNNEPFGGAVTRIAIGTGFANVHVQLYELFERNESVWEVVGRTNLILRAVRP